MLTSIRTPLSVKRAVEEILLKALIPKFGTEIATEARINALLEILKRRFEEAFPGKSFDELSYSVDKQLNFRLHSSDEIRELTARNSSKTKCEISFFLALACCKESRLALEHLEQIIADVCLEKANYYLDEAGKVHHRIDFAASDIR